MLSLSFDPEVHATPSRVGCAGLFRYGTNCTSSPFGPIPVKPTLFVFLFALKCGIPRLNHYFKLFLRPERCFVQRRGDARQTTGQSGWSQPFTFPCQLSSCLCLPFISKAFRWSRHPWPRPECGRETYLECEAATSRAKVATLMDFLGIPRPRAKRS